MDMKRGTFHHWPIQGTWLDNEEALGLMRATWRACRFFNKIADPKYTQWSDEDVAYHTWVDKGRATIERKSDYERWLESQTTS